MSPPGVELFNAMKNYSIIIIQHEYLICKGVDITFSKITQIKSVRENYSLNDHFPRTVSQSNISLTYFKPIGPARYFQNFEDYYHN